MYLSNLPKRSDRWTDAILTLTARSVSYRFHKASCILGIDELSMDRMNFVITLLYQ